MEGAVLASSICSLVWAVFSSFEFGLILFIFRIPIVVYGFIINLYLVAVSIVGCVAAKSTDTRAVATWIGGIVFYVVLKFIEVIINAVSSRGFATKLCGDEDTESTATCKKGIFDYSIFTSLFSAFLCLAFRGGFAAIGVKHWGDLKKKGVYTDDFFDETTPFHHSFQ
eukprot:TRINITY_DN14985_c0_g1_i1.p1 TRINITY_DN14985_c0_g1~~TRINITY_DN14985_c0_g1_i1.p1  ORF type:complete len:168 (-),score=32.29 TRINITY_DN14985_c0_g1_i1:162-665(-)